MKVPEVGKVSESQRLCPSGEQTSSPQSEKLTMPEERSEIGGTPIDPVLESAKILRTAAQNRNSPEAVKREYETAIQEERFRDACECAQKLDSKDLQVQAARKACESGIQRKYFMLASLWADELKELDVSDARDLQVKAATSGYEYGMKTPGANYQTAFFSATKLRVLGISEAKEFQVKAARCGYNQKMRIKDFDRAWVWAAHLYDLGVPDAKPLIIKAVRAGYQVALASDDLRGAEDWSKKLQEVDVTDSNAHLAQVIRIYYDRQFEAARTSKYPSSARIHLALRYAEQLERLGVAEAKQLYINAAEFGYNDAMKRENFQEAYNLASALEAVDAPNAKELQLATVQAYFADKKSHGIMPDSWWIEELIKISPDKAGEILRDFQDQSSMER